MFGCYAVYVKNRIALIFRNNGRLHYDNGVWLAASHEHHEALRHDSPSMCSIKLFGGNDRGWQNLPHDATDVEEGILLKNGW